MEERPNFVYAELDDTVGTRIPRGAKRAFVKGASEGLSGATRKPSQGVKEGAPGLGINYTVLLLTIYII